MHSASQAAEEKSGRRSSRDVPDVPDIPRFSEVKTNSEAAYDVGLTFGESEDAVALLGAQAEPLADEEANPARLRGFAAGEAGAILLREPADRDRLLAALEEDAEEPYLRAALAFAGHGVVEGLPDPFHGTSSCQCSP